MSLRGSCWRIAFAVALVAGAVGAWAQFPPGTDRGAWAEAQFIPQDRQLANLLERARAQLAGPESDQRRGLETVQRILDTAEDYFTDRKFGGSLRGNAESLLAGLPESGRQLYEQMYGVEARALLNAAPNANDAWLNDVMRRFLLTQAGNEAALTRAVIEMDRGRFLTAARLFEHLWRLRTLAVPAGVDVWERAVTAYWKAGVPNASEALFLQAFTESNGALSWRGKPVPNFTIRSGAVQWLREQLGPAGAFRDAVVTQWLLPGGEADRNASAVSTSPVFDNAWRAPLLGRSDANSPRRLEELELAVESVNAIARNEEQWQTYAVAEPLVIGDTLLSSSYGRIKAVDARTGALRWQAADADPVFEYLAQGQGPAGGVGVPPSTGTTLLESFVAQRAWLDRTSAGLSSDRERVYQVFDTGLITAQQPYHLAGSGPHPLSLPSYNRLRAYDLETEGKLLWEIGGPPGRVSLPLAGTFFLGAPLPLDDALYVLGEERGQVRLIVLDPLTGELRWSTALLNTTVDINVDLERRLAGLSPAHAGGILVCPTGGGLVVAVDVAQRSLVWAYVYDEPKATRPPDVFGGRLQQFNDVGDGTPSIETLLATPRWSGPTTLIAGHRVVHAPPNHAVLHCVNLLDGQLLWTRPRQRLMSLAGVHDDTVILVGERHVEAARITSGETIWELPLGPPSGTGVREGRLLRLPLRGGDLATIDLDSGRLLARSATRSGAELGSLVAAGGRLFSQTLAEVRGFRSLNELHEQITADLAADPHDPAALSVRGELRLHAGQADEALADLRAAYALVPDDRIRGLIVGTLLERLREDFASHRDTVPELDRLTSDPVQRLRLLRIVADGLETAGDLLAAYGRYLELFALEGLADETEHVSDTHAVRLDRWVQGRLQRLSQRAAPEIRSEFEARMTAYVDAAIADRDVERLGRAASAFADSPAGKSAIQALADAIDPVQDALRAEALWLRQRREGTPEIRAAALARLIRLYANHGRGELADALLRELSETDQQALVRDGKSGPELAAALRESPPVAAALSTVTHWPTASIDVRPQQEGAQPQLRTNPLRVIGPSDPLIESTVIHSDGRDEMVAYDGFGNPEWTDRMRSSLGYAFPDSHYVERRGHRALLFLDNQFRVIDMLHYRRQPRSILEESLSESGTPDRLGRTVNRLQRERIGLRTYWRRDEATGRLLGLTGPLRDDLFCFQRGATLFAVDPFRGDVLWRLEEVPYGCEILADDQYVVLIPPDPRNDRQEARVFQAADGTFIGSRWLPSEVVRLRQGADWGRLFLTQTPHAGTSDATLAMYDPLSGKNLWERVIPQFLAWAPLDGFDLVVLAESGQLQLLDAQTGDVRLETQTEIAADVKSMTVVGHPDEWFLFTERSPAEQQQTRLLLPSNRTDHHAVNGVAYAFDRRTHERLWSREILSLLVDPKLPGRWPLLVLSSEAWTVPGEGRGRAATKYQNLLLLNKRTGDVVFEGDGSGRWQGTAWSLSEDKPQLRLSFNGTGLAVSFSDEPPSEAAADVPPPAGRDPAQPPPPPPPPPPPSLKGRVPSLPPPLPADAEEM
ncbi:MAG: PQQ-binding-like beta-propeller repeat protein [Planctomycetaceae bacterium]